MALQLFQAGAMGQGSAPHITWSLVVDCLREGCGLERSSAIPEMGETGVWCWGLGCGRQPGTQGAASGGRARVTRAGCGQSPTGPRGPHI